MLNQFKIVLLILVFTSCKKEPVDPCLGEEVINPYFKIEELIDLGGSYGHPMENDSINGSGNMQFTSFVENADEYKWQVGVEPNPRYGKQIKVLFNKVYGEIKVKLTVTKRDVNRCFPEAVTIDSFERSFWIFPFDTSILYGTYIGQIDNRSKKDTVIITSFNGSSRVLGLEESCSPLKPEIRVGTTYQFYIPKNSNLCSVNDAIGKLDKNTKILTVDYWERDKNANYIKRYFKGFKQ